VAARERLLIASPSTYCADMLNLHRITHGRSIKEKQMLCGSNWMPKERRKSEDERVIDQEAWETHMCTVNEAQGKRGTE